MTETIYIGVDEAGRGPLFGRVYASACIIPNIDEETDFDFSCIKDSKKFSSSKKIMKVYEYIKENAYYYSTEYNDETVIDDVNILQATQKAMHVAVKNVLSKYLNDNPDCNINNIKILVDGNYFNELSYYWNDELNVINHECVISGDDIHKCIGAASILSKVERDLYIEEICTEHPELNERYCLLKNKGYGTKQHIQGIRDYGYSDFHRKSFKLKKL